MKNTIKIMALLACLLLFAAGCTPQENNTPEVTSFEECVEAGYDVMESHPRQCEADGIIFTEVIDENGESLAEQCESEGGTWLPEHHECEDISETFCSELGGSFESCASACRHDPDAEMCIEVCVPVCSFEGSEDYVDENDNNGENSQGRADENNYSEITSFQECVDAGNPVMESYPAQCEADGTVFVQELSDEEMCENLFMGTWLPEHNECEGISEDECYQLDGVYDSCASACRHEPEGTPCTKQCVFVCEVGAGASDDVNNGHDDLPISEECESEGGTWLPEHNECEYIEKDFCTETGGTFYDCESACRHDPDAEMCIDVCVPVCRY